MEIRLLGPLQLVRGDSVVPLPRRQQRALLAVLALHADEVVSTDRLIEDLWGSDAPRSALGSLQNAVHSLRKVVGLDVLVTEAPGYRLALAAEDVDALRFERLFEEARAAPAGTRGKLLAAALALWRGPALDDLAFEPFAGPEIARLEGLRLDGEEERLAGELGLGRHDRLVPELEALVAANPLRERLRGQLMLALYRSGRHAEALEVYRAARLALADELGLDPSPELQRLERAILRHDPALEVREEPATELPAAPRERRVISVLAAAPPALDDPELLLASLEALLERTRSTLLRNDGTLERFGPEGLVATFSGRDDDALRAVRSAVELALPAGVSTGEAVLAEAGATGAVVTRASEFAHNGGGIRLDARTFALVRDAVTAEQDGDVFLVTNLDEAAEGRTRRLDLPLVGRVEELERLRGAFDDVVAASRCRVVTVLGEPGIGKTRLAREAAQLIGKNATVQVARCLSDGEGATFLPLLTTLRRAEPERALRGEPDAALVVERLAALADGTDVATLGESYWAVRRLLETLASRTPVLLVLDDVHWAEPALLDLVDYLAERVAAPLLVLCLARPELERPLGETFTLGPLAADDARAVAEGIAELDDATQARIVELAEGNALYIEQLAIYAVEGGEGLPPTLEAVLSGRLGRLPDAERNVLQRAAVAGREFSRGAVAALTETPVDAFLLSLSRRGLIHPAADATPGDDGYRFHHVLLRDTAYQTLTKRERARLHERSAAWLDHDALGDDTLVGYHLERAARLRQELGSPADEVAATAGERLGKAGIRALDAEDLVAAKHLLERATRLLPDGPLRASQLRQLAEVQWSVGELDAVAGTLDEALSVAAKVENPALQASIKLTMARAATFGVGDLRSTVDEYHGVLATALPEIERDGDPRALASALASAATLRMLEGSWQEAGRAAETGIAHCRRAGLPLSDCISRLAMSLCQGPTRTDEAIERCHELLDEGSGGRFGQANVSMFLGALMAMRGRFTEAHRLCDEAHDILQDLQSKVQLASWWVLVRADLARAEGDIETLERVLRGGYDELERLRQHAATATIAAELASVLCTLERIPEAQRLLRRSRAIGMRGDFLPETLRATTNARIAARSGKHVRARRLGGAALASLEGTDSLGHRAKLMLDVAEVARFAGDPNHEMEPLIIGAGDLYRAKGHQIGAQRCDELQRSI